MSLAEELGFDFKDEPCEQFLESKFPCRKCLPCLIRRQRAWVTRLTEELREHDHNYFITLTYSPEHVPADEFGLMAVFKPHVQKLNQDLRKRFQQGFFNFHYHTNEGIPMVERMDLPDYKFKYYITSEYGPVGGLPHYHGVWYDLPADRYLVECLFKELWPYGFITVYPALEGAAGYISKYLVNDSVGKASYTDEYLTSPFALMSKGLGKSYVERMLEYHQADWKHRVYFQFRGQKAAMDRYLKHKIFNEEQLQYFAELFYEKNSDKRYQYYRLKLRHPALYQELLEEREKYYEDQRYSQQQRVLKKQSLK